MSLDQVQPYDLTHLESKLKCELRSEFREEDRALREEIRKVRYLVENFMYAVIMGVLVAVPWVIVLISEATKR